MKVKKIMIGVFFAIMMIISIAGCSNKNLSVNASKKKDVVSKVTIEVTQNDGDSKVEKKTIEIKEKETLFEVMKKNFKIEDNKGFITSINGIKQDTKANKYWFFNVNGTSGVKGADKTELKNGDDVKWDLHAAS
ncbi:DUF4430 domain-containing protein [Bacillus cereus]|uniref:DUF4430 domain-containing protein n=1 Tax=Bacillus cereus TaxID=1396 RepID=UPI000BF9AF32|nr:DUF4430 domain-containing protein [Bacillus cereus]PEX93254.1 hypothetical protein CN450_03635 [Bacillus cereus]